MTSGLIERLKTWVICGLFGQHRGWAWRPAIGDVESARLWARTCTRCWASETCITRDARTGEVVPTPEPTP